MKDFSQHGEQEKILDFFGDFKGRFLDIGAFDGVTGSNTAGLVAAGWTGVCIEANPINFALLLKNSPHTVSCCNAAVMPRAGLVKFYDTDGQLGTCLEKNFLNDLVKRFYWVATITPAMIAATFGGKFDFISLDVEGVDLDVLMELDPVVESARLLCFEDSIPCQSFNPDYYQSLIAAAAARGFSKTIARTGPGEGRGNTLIARP